MVSGKPQNVKCKTANEYPKHRVKDFDWQRYKKDIVKLFEAEDWVQPVESES